jgi:hypothetical protein
LFISQSHKHEIIRLSLSNCCLDDNLTSFQRNILMFFNTPKPKPDTPEEPGLDVKVNLRVSQDAMIKLLLLLTPLILTGVGGAASVRWWMDQTPSPHSPPAPPAEVVRPQK